MVFIPYLSIYLQYRLYYLHPLYSSYHFVFFVVYQSTPPTKNQTP